MTTHVQQAKSVRHQLRGFIAVWVGLTLLMGVATFVGIYVGTDSLAEGNESDDTVVSIANNPDFRTELNNTNSQPVTVDNNPAPAANPAVDDAPAADTNAETDNNTAANNTAGSEPEAEAAIAADTNEETDRAPVADQSSESGMGNNTIAQDEGDTADIVGPDVAAPPAQDDPTPQPQPTIPPVQNEEFDLGIQVRIPFENNEERMTNAMNDVANNLNLNWVKLQVRWEFVEPEPGVYDWAPYDLFFSKASEQNLRVLISVVTAPDWAREEGVDTSLHGPPADYQVFANFIAQMVWRYQGQIHAVEVWNEMNLAREWTSVDGLSAADYVQMFKVVHDTVRPLDENVILISGALSPTGVDDGVVAISDLRYTDQLIQAGILEYADCYGAHHNGYNIGPNVPFDQVDLADFSGGSSQEDSPIFDGPMTNPHPSWSFYSTLHNYANKIQNAGSDVPLCVTEFGWAVAGDIEDPTGIRPIPNFEFSEDNTLEEQRIFLVEAIESMQEWDFVWLAFIWNLNFGLEAQWDISGADRDNIVYSLIRPHYTPSPAWAYISDMNFRGRGITTP
jgi:hypothetical protein